MFTTAAPSTDPTSPQRTAAQMPRQADGTTSAPEGAAGIQGAPKPQGITPLHLIYAREYTLPPLTCNTLP